MEGALNTEENLHGCFQDDLGRKLLSRLQNLSQRLVPSVAVDCRPIPQNLPASRDSRQQNLPASVLPSPPSLSTDKEEVGDSEKSSVTAEDEASAPNPPTVEIVGDSLSTLQTLEVPPRTLWDVYQEKQEGMSNVFNFVPPESSADEVLLLLK